MRRAKHLGYMDQSSSEFIFTIFIVGYYNIINVLSIIIGY